VGGVGTAERARGCALGRTPPSFLSAAQARARAGLRERRAVHARLLPPRQPDRPAFRPLSHSEGRGPKNPGNARAPFFFLPAGITKKTPPPMKGHPPPARGGRRTRLVKLLVAVNVGALLVFLAATRSMSVRFLAGWFSRFFDGERAKKNETPPAGRALPHVPARACALLPLPRRVGRCTSTAKATPCPCGRMGGREGLLSLRALIKSYFFFFSSSILRASPPSSKQQHQSALGSTADDDASPSSSSLPASAARAARRLGAGARRALPACPPCEASTEGGHPPGSVFQGKYSPYRDPTAHPLDWWATHGGLAAEAAAAAAAGPEGPGKHHLPALPARSYAGPLDVDAPAAARKAALDAAGVDGAPGAARGRRGYFLSYVETDPLYPFQRVRFADGSDTGVVALIAPFYDTNYFRAETQRALFWRLKARGHIIVGVSSYQVRDGRVREGGRRKREGETRRFCSHEREREVGGVGLEKTHLQKPKNLKNSASQEFPGDIVNPYDDRHVTPGDRAIHAAVDGWLHCFREPAKVLPPGVPRILVSQSGRGWWDGERERERNARCPRNDQPPPPPLLSHLQKKKKKTNSSPNPTSPTPPAATAAAPSSPGAWPSSTTSSTRTRAATGTISRATGRSRSTALWSWFKKEMRPSTSWAGTRGRSRS
jgi:hypothetical protein